ncbi:sigma factor [Rhodopirellula sallentina]|nr:sigma factor [Rhodopirellula sallentina]
MESMDHSGQARCSLLARAHDRRDEQAWEEFVGYYQRFIFYVLKQLGVAASDIEDVTQQVLLSLTRELPSYDPQGLREPTRWPIPYFCLSQKSNE